MTSASFSYRLADPALTAPAEILSILSQFFGAVRLISGLAR